MNTKHSNIHLSTKVKNLTDNELAIFDVDGGPIKLDPQEYRRISLKSNTLRSLKKGMLKDLGMQGKLKHMFS